MTQVIWKLALKLTDVQTIEVPRGSVFLHAREQYDEPCIWFRCDPSAPKEDRRIIICGTGHPCPDEGVEYIGTAMLYGATLAFHIFEETR